MLMPPERRDYFNKTLGEQLQRLDISIKSYQALKAVKSAELPNQASRLWELNQRYRLVKGKNEDASFALLAACQDAYKGLHDSILNLVEKLDEVSIQVLESEKEFQQLTKELAIPVCLKELLDFLEAYLKFWQNHMKYLELHLRQLHPKHSLRESDLEAFKADLQFAERIEAQQALALAKIERFVKNPLDFITNWMKD